MNTVSTTTEVRRPPGAGPSSLCSFQGVHSAKIPRSGLEARRQHSDLTCLALWGDSGEEAEGSKRLGLFYGGSGPCSLASSPRLVQESRSCWKGGRRSLPRLPCSPGSPGGKRQRRAAAFSTLTLPHLVLHICCRSLPGQLRAALCTPAPRRSCSCPGRRPAQGLPAGAVLALRPRLLLRGRAPPIHQGGLPPGLPVCSLAPWRPSKRRACCLSLGL